MYVKYYLIPFMQIFFNIVLALHPFHYEVRIFGYIQQEKFSGGAQRGGVNPMTGGVTVWCTERWMSLSGRKYFEETILCCHGSSPA